MSKKKRGMFVGQWRRTEPLDHREINILYSQKSKLNHKPFPDEIGLLMHLSKEILFARPCMGVLQTDEIFDKAPSVF